MSRAAVAFASKEARCGATRTSRIFRRTSVPGYVYGSELSGIERSNLRGHLLGRQVASNISIEDGPGCLGRLKALQPPGSDRARHTSLPLDSFLLRDRLVVSSHA